ncbi:MAG: NAD(P)H-binding protein [Gammaproteobacteria bacterium]
MKKKISILGSGWLGFPLAEHFLSQEHIVRASTRNSARFADLESINIDPYLIDLADFENAKKENKIQEFLDVDILIINITSKSIDHFQGLLKKIDHSTVKNILFVSSTSVYKNTNCTIYEDDNCESDQSPLFQIEKLIKNNQNFRTTIIRFGGLIGYNRKPGNFFRKGNPVNFPEAPINLIHRDDCINIISQIVEQNVWGEIFNCCADTHPTKRAFYTKATQAVGKDVPKFADSEINEFKIIDNTKVKRVLNYEFVYPDLMEIDLS